MQRQPTRAAFDGITVQRFGALLTREFQDSAASFAAFRMSGLTIVVARGDAAAALAEFVQYDLGGEVQGPLALLGGEAA